MRLFEGFYPTYAAKNTYSIDFKKLWDEGFRGVIFDIDNTLVGHDLPADRRAYRFLKSLKEYGFRTMIVSNNEVLMYIRRLSPAELAIPKLKNRWIFRVIR